jgi:hypothetical protein
MQRILNANVSAETKARADSIIAAIQNGEAPEAMLDSWEGWAIELDDVGGSFAHLVAALDPEYLWRCLGPESAVWIFREELPPHASVAEILITSSAMSIDIPHDWVGWGVRSSDGGTPLASVAILSDNLPNYDPHWYGWMLSNPAGMTVAHQWFAKGSRCLWDERWAGWIVISDAGFSVAHQAAGAGQLPGFSPGWIGWRLFNNDGMTTAHLAAATKCLPAFPADWPVWSFEDASGLSVRAIYERESAEKAAA